MDKAKQKLISRNRRQKRVRARISGTALRPRVAVFRSLRYIYAQVIDDTAGKTLLAASDHKSKRPAAEVVPALGKQGQVPKGTRQKVEDVKDKSNIGTRTASAHAVGVKLGELIKAKGIEKIVFDRGGFMYHGRVKALADGLRSAGVQF